MKQRSKNFQKLVEATKQAEPPKPMKFVFYADGEPEPEHEPGDMVICYLPVPDGLSIATDDNLSLEDQQHIAKLESHSINSTTI